MPTIQSHPSESPEISDVDALITKAIHCLNTGQPNLATLYMGKATRIVRQLHPNPWREAAEAVRQFGLGLLDLVKPFTDVIEKLTPPDPSDIIRRNFETSRADRLASLAFDSALADEDYASALGMIGVPAYERGGNLPVGIGYVQNTSTQPIIVRSNPLRHECE